MSKLKLKLKLTGTLFLMQVKMTGTEFAFGDVTVTCARITRRTNDTQHVGTLLRVCHHGACLTSQAEPALKEMQDMVFEELAAIRDGTGQAALAKAFVAIMQPKRARSGEYNGPVKEALLYVAAANAA